MRALYFKEIKSFLSSIIGYIFILIYLIASGLFHWIISYNTNLLEGTEADLIPFFNLSPIIFLILIPAITMRSIAEERRTGTIELLFTRPISDLKILLAKYFAGVTLLIIALVPTIIYYISMYYLGSPVGVIDSGYRGEIMVTFNMVWGQKGVYEVGDRIAQLVIVPVPLITYTEVEELSETERGQGGHGSTGN